MPIKVSICIPTYNRADLLRDTLISIETNIENQDIIEVVISDNNSQDSTPEVINSFDGRIRNLRYYKNTSNIGPVCNLRKAIEMATGEYVWIFSDDDIMAHKSMSYLLGFLSKHPEIDYVFYTREVVDNVLNPVDLGIQPSNLTTDKVYLDGNSLFCGCGGQMPFILGFYSSTIIKRQNWLKNAAKVKIISKDYAWDHLIIILRAIKDSRCAILSKVGVHARLNYRMIKARSKVSFDDSIHCFLEIMKLKYSREICLDTMHSIIRIESKGFVIDKATGYRRDTLIGFFLKNKLKKMIIFSFPWFILSLLPFTVLNALWRMYCWKYIKE